MPETKNETPTCMHCGLRIYWDATYPLGARWRHHGSNYSDCGDMGNFQTAEPLERGVSEERAPQQWIHGLARRLAGSLGYGGYIIDDFEKIIKSELEAVRSGGAAPPPSNIASTPLCANNCVLPEGHTGECQMFQPEWLVVRADNGTHVLSNFGRRHDFKECWCSPTIEPYKPPLFIHRLEN